MCMLRILCAMPFLLGAVSLDAHAGDWPMATPEEVGLAPDIGAKLDAALAQEALVGVHGVVVVRDGKLALERYLTGDDQILGSKKLGVVFGPDSLHDLRSITKSVVGLLYGIALGEGAVPPPDAPLVAAFPEYADLAADPARAAMTVRHALTMTLGTEWDEDARPSSEDTMEWAPDSVRYTLDRPMVAEPGEAWTYNSGATTALARLIARGTGMPLRDFAQSRLFAPLGIEHVQWIGDYYDDPLANSGLRMRPRDAAKIGQLVLQGGVWDGVQIVPADWLAALLASDIEAHDDCNYGYQWWLCATEGGLPLFEASGKGGQELIVVPGRDLVVMVTRGAYGDPKAWEAAFTILEEVVLPSVVTP